MGVATGEELLRTPVGHTIAPFNEEPASVLGGAWLTIWS